MCVGGVIVALNVHEQEKADALNGTCTESESVGGPAAMPG